jgi:hypothetical protein
VAALVGVSHVRFAELVQSGFPDLTLVRDRIVFAEIKRAVRSRGRRSVEVLDALAKAGGEVYVWTLDDLHEIGRILERPSPRFVPLGEVAVFGGAELSGPRLIDDARRVSFAPRSAWIPYS